MFRLYIVIIRLNTEPLLLLLLLLLLGGQMAGFEPRRGHGCRNRAPIKTLGNARSLERRTGKSYSHVHVVTTGYMTHNVRYIANGRG
jgi:hypothetical protein